MIGFGLVGRAARALVLAAAAATAAAGGAGAVEGPVATTENVAAKLVVSVESAAPGDDVLFGLHKVIRPHWHTYWINPGDAGEPTRVMFTAPSGAIADDILWPLPEMISIQDVLMNYGYSGEVLLPFGGRIPETARPGDVVRFEALATWLVCEEICIPEEARLAIDVPVAGSITPDPVWTQRLIDAVDKAPVAADFAAGLERAGERVRLSVADPMLADAIADEGVRDVAFFPYSSEMIVHVADQPVTYGADGLAVDLKPAFGFRNGLVPLDGVLALDMEGPDGWVRRGFEITAQPGGVDIGAVVAAPPTDAGATPGATAGGQAEAPARPPVGLAGLAQAIVFAFVGGLILNLMPCVFPILSIKAFSAVRHAQAHRASARLNGLAFAAGVLFTFLVLAGALLALRAAGAQIGWGFQLQSPAFVTVIALLFFAIGLNLLGVFEVGSGLQRLAGSASGGAHTGAAGSFGVGALAVLAASPCTAPFMSAALPVALTAPAPVALSVFLALGAGFAAPFTLLSFFPGWARALPKPGPWMDTFKQILAFPMFAAAVWLVWVLAVLGGPNAVLLVLVLMTALGFLVWGLGRGGALRWAGGAAMTAAVALVVAGYAAGVAVTPAASASAADGPWSPERVAELRAAGRSVFVDFTAAWCVTCQVNKRVALASEKVRETFEATGTALLTADWTRYDPAITAELARYDRAGVPMYLVFPPEGEPIVLSELLTEGQVIRALTEAAPNGPSAATARND